MEVLDFDVFEKLGFPGEPVESERLWKSVKHANIQHGTNMSAGMQISVKQKNVMPHTKN